MVKREGECRKRQPKQRHRDAGDPEVVGDGRQLRDRHQAACADHHEHRVHNIKWRSLEHFLPFIVAPRLLHRLTRRHFAGLRGAQQQADQDHDDALPKAEPEESRLIAARCDHVGDRNDGECRACAETCRRQACSEAAPVGKPLERVADRAAVNHARANTADRRAEIKQRKRVRDRVNHPRDRNQHARAADHRARAELVDQIAFDRHQPGFCEHEDREGDLNRRAPPVVFLIDRTDEQRPAVLQVGDHHHAYDTEDELTPSGPFGCLDFFCRTCCDCHYFLPYSYVMFVVVLF